MPPRNIASTGKRERSKSPALFDERDLLRPPYRRAAISIQAVTAPGGLLDKRRLNWMLGLADQVEILCEDGQAEAARRLIQSMNDPRINERAKDKIVKNVHEFEDYFISVPDISLAIIDYPQFTQFYDWNERRKKSETRGYDILCHAPERPLHALGATRPLRAYTLASAGGTFNAFHEGHQEYLKSTLRLADEVHILLSDDEYARERKSYSPHEFTARRKSVRRYLRTIGCSSRVSIKRLVSKVDIENFVKTSERLDIVITERAYFDWFNDWNGRREESGLIRFDILCRERSVVRGADLSSSMLVEDQSARRTSAEWKSYSRKLLPRVGKQTIHGCGPDSLELPYLDVRDTHTFGAI